MGKIDFDKIHDRRGTSCSKWDYNKQLFGKDDLLSMWVADMDFPSPPEVFEAITERMKHPILGYTRCIPELSDQIVKKMKRDFDWDIQKEWILLQYDVSSSLSFAVKSLTNVGDEIIIQSPVYYPFFKIIKNNGCQIVDNTLILENNKYTMDFDNLKKSFIQCEKFAGHTHKIKGTILCNPHNPVGRSWTKEELLEYGDICLKNNITIIADEIHCDIVYKGKKHYPIASLSKELEQNTITCMSGGKSFNMGGMAISFTIVPNPVLRKQMSNIAHAEPSVLSICGLAAALKAGGEYYLEELLEYLEGNLDYMMDYINTKIPKLSIVKPEATYLVWVDFKKLNFTREQLGDFMINKAKIAADYGFIFGDSGDNFVRFNIAAPRETLTKALVQLENAVNSL